MTHLYRDGSGEFPYWQHHQVMRLRFALEAVNFLLFLSLACLVNKKIDSIRKVRVIMIGK